MESSNKVDVVQFISQIANFLTDDIVTETTDLGGVILIELKTGNPEFLIGKEGQVIQSLQDLGYAYFQKLKPSEYSFFVVEVSDYRRRYLNYYLSLLEEGINKVMQDKTEFGLPPMNSFLRKIIHSVITHKYGNQLQTESSGDEQNRRVIIRYAGD
jgi:spoIIIJ-associated protein